MSNERNPNESPEILSEAARRFYAIPRLVRDEFIRRSIADYEYLNNQGLTIDDLIVGTVLPNGNTVMADSKGRKYFLAPNPLNKAFTAKDN